MPAETPYGPTIIDSKVFGARIPFGYGTCHAARIPKQPIGQRVEAARDLGWAHGCPVAIELTETCGPDKMIQRYSEVNCTFLWILERARINPELESNLLTPARRRERLPDGKHEPLSVPQSFLEQMAPMTTISGYASPRVLLEYTAGERLRMVNRLRKINPILGSSIKKTTDPLEFLAYLSEETFLRLIKKAHTPVDSSNARSLGLRILSHALAVEVLEEEGCMSMYQELASKVNDLSRHLRTIYLSLTPQEAEQYGIAQIH